jgi:hypothetical protein
VLIEEARRSSASIEIIPRCEHGDQHCAPLEVKIASLIRKVPAVVLFAPSKVP